MQKNERHAAKAIGQKWYFTGVACVKGHIARRRTSNGECFECASIRQAETIGANPEAAKQKWKASRERNKQAAIARSAKWREKNRDHIAEYNKRVRAENPEKFLPYAAKRRARIKGQSGSFSHEDVVAIFKAQRGCCAGCGSKLGKNFDRDHIMPLALGGSNRASNIQLLCPPCNGSKSAKHPIAWAQERGLLL